MSEEKVRNEMMALLAPVPQRLKDRVHQSNDSIALKIDRITRLISENPEWRPDPVVFGRILNFTENIDNKDVREFRTELIIKFCSVYRNGIIHLTNNISISDKERLWIIQICLERGGVLHDGNLAIQAWALLKFDKNEFWNLIREQGVKILFIQKENGQFIEYGDIPLKKFVEKKPAIEDLIEEHTVEFDTGDSIEKMSKASLLLCGGFFEKLFNSNTTISNKISLPGISVNGFLGVLDVMETGKIQEGIDIIAYKRAAAQLEFLHQAILVPQEGIYGKEDWEKYWGKIGNVPPLPKEAFEPCPIMNMDKHDEGSRMLDTFDFIWRPETVNGEQLTIDSIEKIAKSYRFGDRKIGYEYIYDPIRRDHEINKEVEKGYWFAMMKKPLEETRNMTYDEQRIYVANKYPKEYGFPTTDQALIYYLMHRARYGTCVLCRSNDRSAYTRCLETVNGGHVIVGAVAPAGLCLFNFGGSFPYISIILARKF